MMIRPPSLDPSRGIRALEVAMVRLDSAHRELQVGAPAERVSLTLSNVSAMFQQALTIGRHNLPGNDAVNGAFWQAMDGTVLLGRELRHGTAPAMPDIERQFTAWRTTAIDGIAALRAVPSPAASFGAS